MPRIPGSSRIAGLFTVRRLVLAVLALVVIAGVAAALRPDTMEVDTALVRRTPLQVTVDADGRTRNISSTTTDPASFGQHANYAVSRWRFDPASDGATVAATGCTYEFTFEFAENVAGNRSG